MAENEMTPAQKAQAAELEKLRKQIEKEQANLAKQAEATRLAAEEAEKARTALDEERAKLAEERANLEALATQAATVEVNQDFPGLKTRNLRSDRAKAA